MNFGFFITSHGFGHAARACAIINKLAVKKSHNILIFTKTPKWFFENSLQIPFTYFSIQTDVGLVQSDPFNEDLDQTLIELEKYFPYKPDFITSVKNTMKDNNVELVVCDISALGIILADELQIPSVLIENFTWDWIYQFYTEKKPKLEYYRSYFEKTYQKVTIRIACMPYCDEIGQDYFVSPIFREPRQSKQEVLEKLGCNLDETIILISMGGIPIEKFEQKFLFSNKNLKFIVPVKHVSQMQYDGQIIYLPHNHHFFHPDLVNISKLIIGKVGYSTIAEVYSLQKPFMYITRENFPESNALEKFINKNIVSKATSMDEFFTDGWFDDIKKLIQTSDKPKNVINGADQVVKIIEENYGSQFQ